MAPDAYVAKHGELKVTINSFTHFQYFHVHHDMSPPLTQIQNSPISLNLFDYGIAAGVIVALLLILWKGSNFVVGKFEKISERHDATILEINQAHKSERKEWKEESKQREERLTELLETTLNSIRNKNENDS